MPSLFEGLGRLIRLLALLIGSVTAVVLVFGGIFYLQYARNLPRITKISDYRPPIVSEVFANDGTKIGEFWKECRFLVPYEEIPKKMIEAFVASEDARFWEHRGVDLRSILRAFSQNILARRVVEGGSTITQQITRSLLLTHERTLERKIKEALLATQLEQNLTKEEILFLYLNQIFLGNRAYGVAAAARNYFHKDLKELSLAEIALLAGLPSAPNNFSPLRNPDQARKHQIRVLSRMLELGSITPDEMKESLETSFTIYIGGTDKDYNNRVAAPYLLEEVRRFVEQKYGDEALYYGGLKIDTTTDLHASLTAKRVIEEELERIAASNGWKGPLARLKKEEIPSFVEEVHREIAMESGAPTTFPAKDQEALIPTPIEEGELYKAVVLGTDAKGNSTIQIGHTPAKLIPSDRAPGQPPPRLGEVLWVRKKADLFLVISEPEIEGALLSMNPLTGEIKAMVGGYRFKRSEFNRVTQALRQPGSAFKPIVYAAALDKGYTPGSVVVDAPVVYQLGENEYWNPKNYEERFSGPITIRDALAYSVNVVVVKVLHDIGIPYMVAYARKLGIESPIRKYLSSALGASDLTPLELTRAYATLASGGVRPKPFFIRKIVDSKNQILEETQPMARNPDKAFEIPAVPSVPGFNPELLVEGEKVMRMDHLKITNDEKKILYGATIPPGNVISPQTAFLMTHMMKDVILRGSGHRAGELGRPAAGKTGTTNDESDAWFIGMVPDLITSLWLGYDDRRPIGERMTGGVIAAPIWLAYMKEALKDEKARDFAVPPTLASADINSLAGGSASGVIISKAPEAPIPVAGETPSSRGIDFLYEDLNKL